MSHIYLEGKDALAMQDRRVMGMDPSLSITGQLSSFLSSYSVWNKECEPGVLVKGCLAKMIQLLFCHLRSLEFFYFHGIWNGFRERTGVSRLEF